MARLLMAPDRTLPPDELCTDKFTGIDCTGASAVCKRFQLSFLLRWKIQVAAAARTAKRLPAGSGTPKPVEAELPAGPWPRCQRRKSAPSTSPSPSASPVDGEAMAEMPKP